MSSGKGFVIISRPVDPPFAPRSMRKQFFISSRAAIASLLDAQGPVHSGKVKCDDGDFTLSEIALNDSFSGVAHSVVITFSGVASRHDAIAGAARLLAGELNTVVYSPNGRRLSVLPGHIYCFHVAAIASDLPKQER